MITAYGVYFKNKKITLKIGLNSYSNIPYDLKYCSNFTHLLFEFPRYEIKSDYC